MQPYNICNCLSNGIRRVFSNVIFGFVFISFGILSGITTGLCSLSFDKLVAFGISRLEVKL